MGTPSKEANNHLSQRRVICALPTIVTATTDALRGQFCQFNLCQIPFNKIKLISHLSIGCLMHYRWPMGANVWPTGLYRASSQIAPISVRQPVMRQLRFSSPVFRRYLVVQIEISKSASISLCGYLTGMCLHSYSVRYHSFVAEQDKQ